MRNDHRGPARRPNHGSGNARRLAAGRFVNLVDKLVVALAAAILCAVATLGRAEPAPDDFFIYVANDRVDEVKQMLAKGVDPDSVDKNGEPAIVLAARNNPKTLDVLLATKVNVNARNGFGDSAIMVAALGGRLDFVKKLRARGAEVNQTGWTALIYAATGGHDAVVTYLIGEGANINAKSPNGTTALMMAVRENKASTVDLLIARGADVNLRNDAGASALDWAKRGIDKTVAEHLRKAGAKD
jgi:ankyrin repeat protein